MIVFTIAGLLLATLYYYLTLPFDYWAKRGVKHDRPIPIFGTNMKNYLFRSSVASVLTETYYKYPNEQLVGFFRGSRPELLVRDPELARRILVTDFNCFHRRGVVKSSNMELLLKNQIMADDDMWRQLRQRTTPAFSSAKLKLMFQLVEQTATRLQARLVAGVAAGEHCADVRDLMARFTNDILSSIGFGVAADSLNNDDDAMRKLGIKIFSPTRLLYQGLKTLMPKIFRNLKVFGNVEKEIIELTQSVMRKRNYEPCGRNDYIDLLLQYRKKGPMTGESVTERNTDGTPKIISIEMDDAIIAAQSFMFFAAGFETSSLVSSYTLHELAHHPRLQEKVQDEIDSVLARHDNRLTYDAVTEMTYVKQFINESMRIFSPVGLVMRESVQQYTFPGTKVTIDAGVTVMIPLVAYQSDPNIFPEPQEFQPERFDPALMTPMQKLAFMPFGTGPRACVGERLGLLEAVVGVAAVLARWDVRPAPGAPRHPRVSALSREVALIRSGLPLVFQERKLVICDE